MSFGQTLRRAESVKELDPEHRENDVKLDPETAAAEAVLLEDAGPQKADLGRKVTAAAGWGCWEDSIRGAEVCFSVREL